MLIAKPWVPGRRHLHRSRRRRLLSGNRAIAEQITEQAQVARAVDRSLISIRDLSMQTAAGSHQTSIVSGELSKLAVSLNGLVEHFRL
jgi:methyl-accepting chemotaxis protein